MPADLTCTDPDDARDRGLEMLPLLVLLELIVFFNDDEALRELHDRRTPCLWSGREVSVFEYLETLSRTAMVWRRAGGNHEALEDAFALTVDKLTNVPEVNPEGPHLKSHGPDRRCFYRDCLRAISRFRGENPDLGPFELEMEVASILQTAAARALRFSCLEARRSRNPLRSRYGWPVAGETITLWMPTSMSGVRRRAWLEATVDDPDPRRPGERRRVQAIVDSRLGTPHHVALDRASPGSLPRSAGGPLQTLIQQEIGVRGLAVVVAEEKVDSIDRLRPTIQMLGPAPLKALVLRIFSELSRGCYEGKAVAESFGLSPPTLSRFAGAKRDPRRGSELADLWRNVAWLLRAECPVFIEAVEEAGLRPQMESFLRGFLAAETRRNNHAG